MLRLWQDSFNGSYLYQYEQSLQLAGIVNLQHFLIFNSSTERLELIHKLYNGEAFAKGTLRATHFLLDQQKGYIQ